MIAVQERLFRKRAGGRLTRTLDTLLTAYTKQGKFSGTVLAAKDGQVIFASGYGLANREDEIPNTRDSVFRIGSMTKSFTAAAIFQHIESGQLHPQDRLSKYCPDFPNAERITLHHLLTNTSGIPDYVLTEAYERIKKHHMTTAELIALFRNMPLQFEPGTAFGYSNSNWVLLGGILEQITGKPYPQVIQDFILTPLGMTHSGAAWEQPVIARRAHGYVDTGATLFNAEFIDDTTMHGAGALYSTVDDLYNFALAVLEDRTLLRPDTLKTMLTPSTDQPEYAHGWELHMLHGRRSVGHSGGLPGYYSNLVHFPDERATVIILSNLGSAAVNAVTESMAAVLLGEPYQLPAEHAFVTVDPTLLAEYTGVYETIFFNRTTHMHIALDGDHLTMDVRGLPKSVMSALSQTTFYTRSKGEVEMTFVRGANGRISHMDMIWAGIQATAKRVE